MHRQSTTSIQTSLQTWQFVLPLSGSTQHVVKKSVDKNMPCMSLTLDTSHFERSPLNDVAPRNMPRMSFALDTSHLEISLSKNFARANMRLMSVTRYTSQVPIGPCGLLRHLSFDDSLRHASTALLSCTLDRGENADDGVGVLVGPRFNWQESTRV